MFEGFLNDKINLIVGTHAIVKNNSLLSKASLFIVDEEHRFGVKDKEGVLDGFVNKDVLLISEIFGDTSQWLQGDRFDGTMNYSFRETMTDY